MNMNICSFQQFKKLQKVKSALFLCVISEKVLIMTIRSEVDCRIKKLRGKISLIGLIEGVILLRAQKESKALKKFVKIDVHVLVL